MPPAAGSKWNYYVNHCREEFKKDIAEKWQYGNVYIGEYVNEKTIKEVVDSAFEAYLADTQNSIYCIGSVVGPHPFPMMVRDFQSVIGTIDKNGKTAKKEKATPAENSVLDYMGIPTKINTGGVNDKLSSIS